MNKWIFSYFLNEIYLKFKWKLIIIILFTYQSINYFLARGIEIEINSEHIEHSK